MLKRGELYRQLLTAESLLISRRLYVNECDKIPHLSSTSTFTRSSALSKETHNRVIEFYQCEDISRQAPGRKDITSVRMADGMKTKLQTRHLTSSIKETHTIFQDEYPDAKVGKSKFAILRPHVLLSNKLPHNVCLSKSHENLIAATDALHKAIPNFTIHYQRPFSVTLPLRIAGSEHVTYVAEVTA